MHDFSPLYVPAIPPQFAPFLAVALVWTLVLKGFALWYAARGSQKWWFVILLVVNTLGILEIIYLIWFRPKQSAAAPAQSSSPAQ
ncbi:MAG TPA: DUF5652 family protein [Candidatus Paceibacterota bacterium]|nr:DUF5652 family protein [Candidatus Paceibacterota bacterium]